MRKQVYKCSCGLWARKELKLLTEGKAICPCGREMWLGYKDIDPLPSMEAQNLLVLRAAVVKEKGG